MADGEEAVPTTTEVEETEPTEAPEAEETEPTEAQETGQSQSPSPPPAEWGDDISPADGEPGQLFKKVLKEGEGDEYPQKGNEVFVHYTGRLLDGTVFDSSVERNEQFRFKLGQGTVIKGWDVGVATMRKGEKCLLTCLPEFAYGESGSGDKIPPNSTLQFEVELFNWQGEDVTNDGGVILYLIKEGTGYRKPTDGSPVKIHMIGKYEDNVIEDREVEFDLGEGCESSVIEGVEKALPKMKEAEEAKLVIQPKYAFGDDGDESKGVPPNAVVIYRITLISFAKVKASYEYDEVQERITDSTALKEKGSNYFKAGKYKLALTVYKRGLGIVEKSSVYKDEEKEATKEIRILLLLNMAACNLKLTVPFEVKDQCDKVLEEDATNAKANFRRGQAFQQLQDYEEALKCFQEVLKQDARNRSAQQQIQACRQKMKQQLEKDKKLYANMFKTRKSEAKKPVVKEVAKEATEETNDEVKDGEEDSPVKDTIAKAAENQAQEIAMET